MKLKLLFLLLSAQFINILGETTVAPDVITTPGSGVPASVNDPATTTETSATTAGTDALTNSNQDSSSSTGGATSDQGDSSSTADSGSNQAGSQTDGTTSFSSGAGDTPAEGSQGGDTSTGEVSFVLTDEVKALLNSYNVSLATVMQLFPQVNQAGNDSISLPTNAEGEKVTVTFKETGSDQSNQNATSTASNMDLLQSLQAIKKQIVADDTETKETELMYLDKLIQDLTPQQDEPDSGPQARRNTLRTASTGTSFTQDSALPMSTSGDVLMERYNTYKNNLNRLQNIMRMLPTLRQNSRRFPPQFFINLRNEISRLRISIYFLSRRYPSLPQMYSSELNLRRLPPMDTSLRGNFPGSFVPGIGSSGLSRFNNFLQFRQQLRNQVASPSTNADGGLLTGTVTGSNVQISNSLDSLGRTRSTLDILRDIEAAAGRGIDTGDPDFIIRETVWDNYYSPGTSAGSPSGGTSASATSGMLPATSGMVPATSGMLPASSLRSFRINPNIRFQNSRRFTMLNPRIVMRPRLMFPTGYPFVGPPPRSVF